MSIRLMTRVWDETRFKGTDLLILLCLADHANDDGLCWPSYQTLAKRARCSRRQAIRCVQKLSAEGWVRIEHVRIGDRMNKSNRFHLCIPSDAMSPVTNGEGGGDILGDFDVPNVTRVVSPMSPKPSGNRKGTTKGNLVPAQGRASVFNPSDYPTTDEADEIVAECTSCDFPHTDTCVDAWFKSVESKGERINNWRAHLGAFAEKFESDYRR
jgi:hypothetical protein